MRRFYRATDGDPRLYNASTIPGWVHVSNQWLASGSVNEIVTEVAAHARRLGLSAAVSVNVGEGLSLSVRSREIETLEHHQDKTLSVTVYAGTQKGSATTTDFSSASLEEIVTAAARIARFTEVDRHAGLIEPEYLARDIPPLDLDHPWSITVEDATEMALACEEAALTYAREVAQVDEAGVSLYRGLHAYADTQGFAASYTATRHGVNCIVVGARGGAMQRGYWYSTARHADELEDPVSIGRRASERAVAKLGARKLRTRKAPVLF
ncbi:MAG: PmbA/TldA family metallopeptidase, partial [Gammaproteobacteria bacterium]